MPDAVCLTSGGQDSTTCLFWAKQHFDAVLALAFDYGQRHRIELQAAQARAEAVAQGVSRQADLLNIRRNEQNEKLEEFRILGEKVRDLNTVISGFRSDPAKLKSNIPAVEAQLATLIEQLQTLRQSARNSRMKALEKNIESLVQSLQAARKKLADQIR